MRVSYAQAGIAVFALSQQICLCSHVERLRVEIARACMWDAALSDVREQQRNPIARQH